MQKCTHFKKQEKKNPHLNYKNGCENIDIKKWMQKNKNRKSYESLNGQNLMLLGVSFLA